MSKKKTAQLKREWKLRKDYIDHKQNKKEKIRGFAEEEEVRHKKRRGGGFCKKTKEEHIWKLTENKKHPFMNGFHYTYECTKCGKTTSKPKYEYKCRECGGKQGWLWAMFNMEEYRLCRKCGSKNIEQILMPA